MSKREFDGLDGLNGLLLAMAVIVAITIPLLVEATVFVHIIPRFGEIVGLTHLDSRYLVAARMSYGETVEATTDIEMFYCLEVGQAIAVERHIGKITGIRWKTVVSDVETNRGPRCQESQSP